MRIKRKKLVEILKPIHEEFDKTWLIILEGRRPTGKELEEMQDKVNDFINFINLIENGSKKEIKKSCK